MRVHREPTDRPAHRRISVIGAAAVLALVATLVLLGVGGLASASPAKAPADDEQRGSHGTRPTIVLVHGDWADASSWSLIGTADRVITPAQQRLMPWSTRT